MRHPRLSPDETGAFQGEHHLMYGGRADPEMALHVGLGRRPALDARVGLDEGQVLALPIGQHRVRRGVTHLTDPVHGGLEPREVAMNVRYRVELSEAALRQAQEQRTDRSVARRPACRTLKRAQILLAADAGESEAIIARHIAVSASTGCRTKRRLIEGTPRAAPVGLSRCWPAKWCG